MERNTEIYFAAKMLEPCAINISGLRTRIRDTSYINFNKSINGQSSITIQPFASILIKKKLLPTTQRDMIKSDEKNMNFDDHDTND